MTSCLGKQRQGCLPCGFGHQLFWPAYMDVQSKQLQQVVFLSWLCLDIWKVSQLFPTSSCYIPAHQPVKEFCSLPALKCVKMTWNILGKDHLPSLDGFFFFSTRKMWAMIIDRDSRIGIQRQWRKRVSFFKRCHQTLQALPLFSPLVNTGFRDTTAHTPG